MTEEEALAEARGSVWLPAQPVHSIEEAARFVNTVGFALLFPADRLMLPSLWEAIAGPDAVPFANGMGAAELMIWTWKDTLPEAGLAWCGKFLHQRASLLAPDLLAALYPGAGELDDHLAFPVTAEAHQIAEALLAGPLPSSALRELVGNRSRYERAVLQLQRLLLVTSAGVFEQRAGWPAVLLDLTCRRFDVGNAADHGYAAARFLTTMVRARPADLAKALGWPIADARARLDELAAAGRAAGAADGYRAVSV